MCARTLECGHSEAPATRRAHGIERDIADDGDQMIFIHRQRPEATLEQAAGLPSPRIEVSSVETALRANDADAKPAGSDGARTRWTGLGHEARGPNRNAELSTRFCEPIAIEPTVPRLEEKQKNYLFYF